MTAFFSNLSPVKRWVLGLSALVVVLAVLLVLVPKPGDVAEEVAAFSEMGKTLKVSHFVAMTLAWAVRGTLLIALILLALSKWWAAPLPETDSMDDRMPRSLGIALLAIVLLAGGLRWNLAHQGLWWDELWQTKNATVGYYLGDPEEPLQTRRFLEGSFERTLWQYRLPTNHPIASTPARVMHLLTQDPADPLAFDEFALRAPGLAAGLATVFLVGLLGWRIGGVRVAIFAALLLAIHPWHIRYSVDLRSYAWMMLWATLAMLCLHRLARERAASWGAIAGLGATQFLIVYSSMQAVWLAAAIFVTACLLAVRGWGSRLERVIAVRRVVFAHVLAGMAFLMLAAPLLPQIPIFLARYQDNHFLTLPRFQNLIHEVFWGRLDLDMPLLVSPLGYLAGWALLIFGLASGLRWLSRRTSWLPVVLALFVGAALTLAFYSLGKAFFYTRFVVYLLPPLVLTIACGWGHWASEEFGKVGRSWMLPGIAGLGLYLAITLPTTTALMTRPFEPLREIAERLDAPDVFPVGYGHGVEVLPMYLPEVRIAKNRADLERYLAEARASGKTALLAVGHEALNRLNAPDGYVLIDDPAAFEPVESYDAIGESFFYRVLRARRE